MIEAIVHEVEVGEVFTGRVTRFSKKRIENIEDVLEIGDEIRVEVTEIDDKGRINLSHKKFDK